jgi:hypothetical protein
MDAMTWKYDPGGRLLWEDRYTGLERREAEKIP